MSDAYYFYWLISTGQVPALIFAVLFVCVIVGLFLSGVDKFD